MSESLTLLLANRPQAWAAIKAQVFPFLAQALQAERRWTLTVRPEKRSDEQNRRFHAMCADISRAGIQWAGKPRTPEQWKVLLVSGHATATKEGAEIIPGIEGEFVNIRESTALMSKKRGSSLIEYTFAFGAEHGVRWSDPAMEAAA
jgi:hypothetical protein